MLVRGPPIQNTCATRTLGRSLVRAWQAVWDCLVAGWGRLGRYVLAVRAQIPREIGLMAGLVGFRAAHNRLSGTIPDVGGLGKLEALHLFNNQLVGGDAR